MPHWPKGFFVDQDFPPRFPRVEVNGKRVVRDVVLASALSKRHGVLIPLHGTRVVTLDDGEVVHACAECEFTGTRGGVSVHRADPGVVCGKTEDRPVEPPLPVPAVPVAGVTPVGVGGVADDARSLTVGEILDLAGHIHQWDALLSRQEEQLAGLRAQVTQEATGRRAAQRELEALKRKMKRLIGDV